jgi:hypothetical protein
MPITEFLDGYNPDPETKRVMGIAFEMARVALEREWGDHANAIIAKRIIDLAKGGERNPDVLCDWALDGSPFAARYWPVLTPSGRIWI